MLVRESGTSGARVAFWLAAPPQVVAKERRVFERAFKTIGYRVSVRTFHDIRSYYTALGKSTAAQVQAGVNGWFADYPAPSTFFSILSCSQARNPVQNGSRFCSRSLDAEIRSAVSLQSRDQTSAASAWAKIDREATGTAAVVPMFTPRSVDLVSKRVGNYQHHPLFGVLLDQLWVK